MVEYKLSAIYPHSLIHWPIIDEHYQGLTWQASKILKVTIIKGKVLIG
jgi:hypothetical protein